MDLDERSHTALGRSGQARVAPECLIIQGEELGMWRHPCRRLAPELKGLVLQSGLKGDRGCEEARRECKNHLHCRDLPVLAPCDEGERDVVLPHRDTGNARFQMKPLLWQSVHQRVYQCAGTANKSHRLRFLTDHRKTLWST